MAILHKTLLFLIPITFMLALSSLPYSLSIESDKEYHLRGLCTNNFRADLCWNIIKTNSDRFDNDDDSAVAAAAIDLAFSKGQEILDKLIKWHTDSDNNELKDKYQTCINNYNDATRDIEQARGSLESSNREDVLKQIHSALDDFEECRHSFDRESFDPANVIDRNKEFVVYAQLAMAAAAADKVAPTTN